MRWEANLFGADERGHDAHVGRQEELQAHDEDGQDSKRHQLQTVVHQLQSDKFTHSLIKTNKKVQRKSAVFNSPHWHFCQCQVQITGELLLQSYHNQSFIKQK